LLSLREACMFHILCATLYVVKFLCDGGVHTRFHAQAYFHGQLPYIFLQPADDVNSAFLRFLYRLDYYSMSFDVIRGVLC